MLLNFAGEIHCIHGFLGRPSDWEAVFSDKMSAKKIDLFSEKFARQENLWALGNAINEEARAQGTDPSPGPRILLGYSLGGRAAMHALLAEPENWDAAVIISAHPGLRQEAERGERLKNDSIWAKRFLQMPWDELMNEWNRLPVFSGDEESRSQPVRRESEFSRKILATSLERWSLGTQLDLREKLSSLERPVLWVAGGADLKYRAIAEECASLNPAFEIAIVNGCGHRVPWGNPAEFESVLIEFLKSSKEN